ncbi:SRPBCC family protein [Hansschlegelia sp. KR7-227]|uniref:SRPBCC family protein n=1 Tax=Hansschlegelia sp. KR7-227 TaxID=3400914 RepID=UPI003BFC5BA8
MFKRFTLVAAAMLAAGPAFAADVTESTPVNAPAAKVWATIGGFCGIAKWHPAVEGCALSEQGGKPIRTLSLKGGGTIVEQETGRDDVAMKYSYVILESPLPVQNYISTIAVTDNGKGGAVVTWSGQFEPKGAEAAAKTVIDGIYVKGLAGIVDKST